MRELAPGERLGAYEIRGLLGRGSRSVVYLAEQVDLRALVALRVFAPDPAGTSWFDLQRGLLKRLMAVRHPNLVGILAVGEDKGCGYATLTLARGPDLGAVLARRRMAGPDVAALITQVAGALGALHHAGLVHGDVRAANVLFDGDPSAPVVLVGDPDPGASGSGSPGSLDYLAPERIGGSLATVATDVYALGCMLLHAASGRAPFAGDGQAAVLQSHLVSPPPRLVDLGVSAAWARAVDEVVAHALAKYPRDRFASCAELAAAAERAMDSAAGAQPAHAAPAHGAEVAGVSWGAQPRTAPAPAAPAPLRDDDRPDDEAEEWDWDAILSSRSPLDLRPEPADDPTGTPGPDLPGPDLPGPDLAGPDLPGPDLPDAHASEWLPDHPGESPFPALPDPDPRARVSRVAGGGEPLSTTDLALRLSETVVVPTGVEAGAGDLVDFAPFAPHEIAVDSTVVVQVFVHGLDDEDLMRAMDADPRRGSPAVRTMASRVPAGTPLHLDLSAPTLEIAEPLEGLEWDGHSQAVSFEVQAPWDAPLGPVVVTLGISQSCVPIGHVRFAVEVVDRLRAAVEATGPEPAGADAGRYRNAYAACAPADRRAADDLLSSLDVAGITVVGGSEAGTGSAECDLFLLFWSQAAKESASLRREVGHALDRRGTGIAGRPQIRPVLLAGGASVRPWPEIAHLNFTAGMSFLLDPRDQPTTG